MVEGRLKGRVLSMAPEFEGKLEGQLFPSYMEGWLVRFDVKTLHWGGTESSQADLKALVMNGEEFPEV